MPLDPELLARFHRALVDEIRRSRPEYLDHSFTVAEIYQDLVPYRTHRNVIGVSMNGDYEDALLRLLAGEGEYLVLASEPASREIRKALESSNPDTSLYREFAAVDVRLNPAVRDWVEPDLEPVTTAAPHGEDGAVTPDGEGELAEAQQAGPAEDPQHDGDAAAEAVRAGSEVAPDTEVVETGDRIWAIEASAPYDAVTETAETRAAGPGTTTSDELCSWCAQPLPDRPGMSYCPHCGGDVRLVPCPACGEALEHSWRFCVACGTEVVSS